MFRSEYLNENYQKNYWSKRHVLMINNQKSIVPWWNRGKGLLYHMGFELMSEIEYFQGLRQFHPEKEGGWIPILVCTVLSLI